MAIERGLLFLCRNDDVLDLLMAMMVPWVRVCSELLRLNECETTDNIVLCTKLCMKSA